MPVSITRCEDIARDLAVACLNQAEIRDKLLTFEGPRNKENSKAKGKQIGEFYLGILDVILAEERSLADEQHSGSLPATSR